MEKSPVEITPLNIINFIFSFVQRTAYSYAHWFSSQVAIFAKNWLDFTVKPTATETLDLFSQCIDTNPKPKYVCVPLGNSSNSKELKKQGISVWTANETKELAKLSNSKSATNNDQFCLRIQEVTHCGKDSEAIEGIERKHKVQEVKTREYVKLSRRSSRKGTGNRDCMTGTTAKLSEYNQKNREYLLSKYMNGPDVDSFVFVHPSAKSGFSGNSLLLKNNVGKVVRKKDIPFKPTELSTIFENLAY